jgi:hypothetical protein
LGFKYVSKSLLVPGFDFLLEVLEFLMKPVHLGTSGNHNLLPPNVSILLEVRVV